jgi:hypothetical protein
LENILQDFTGSGVVAGERVELFGIAEAVTDEPVARGGFTGVWLADGRRRAATFGFSFLSASAPD